MGSPELLLAANAEPRRPADSAASPIPPDRHPQGMARGDLRSQGLSTEIIIAILSASLRDVHLQNCSQDSGSSFFSVEHGCAILVNMLCSSVTGFLRLCGV